AISYFVKVVKDIVKNRFFLGHEGRYVAREINSSTATEKPSDPGFRNPAPGVFAVRCLRGIDRFDCRAPQNKTAFPLYVLEMSGFIQAHRHPEFPKLTTHGL